MNSRRQLFQLVSTIDFWDSCPFLFYRATRSEGFLHGNLEYKRRNFASRHFSENASYYAELDQRHKELVGETVEIGLMFASKAFVQLLINPVVGLLTYR